MTKLSDRAALPPTDQGARDDRLDARRIILARRAQYVALALAAAGAATNACGGDDFSIQKTGGGTSGFAGGMTACLGAPDTGGEGGATLEPCLSGPLTAGMSACLSTGGMSVCLAATGGVWPGSGSTAGTGGMSGCLSTGGLEVTGGAAGTGNLGPCLTGGMNWGGMTACLGVSAAGSDSLGGAAGSGDVGPSLSGGPNSGGTSPCLSAPLPGGNSGLEQAGASGGPSTAGAPPAGEGGTVAGSPGDPS